MNPDPTRWVATMTARGAEFPAAESQAMIERWGQLVAAKYAGDADGMLDAMTSTAFIRSWGTDIRLAPAEEIRGRDAIRTWYESTLSEAGTPPAEELELDRFLVSPSGIAMDGMWHGAYPSGRTSVRAAVLVRFDGGLVDGYDTYWDRIYQAGE
jgi:hypothetical protein